MFPYRIGLFQRGRPRGPADLGPPIHAALQAFGESYPFCSAWFAHDPGHRARRCSRVDHIVEQMEGGVIEWDEGMRSPSAPSHRTHFFSGAARIELADVAITFALDGDPAGPHWGVRVDISLGAAFGVGSPREACDQLRALFHACVKAFTPDWAFLGTPTLPARVGRRISAGCLTYVAGTSLPGRTPGPPAVVDRLDLSGHVVTADPEHGPDDTREHIEAVQAVQRALDGEDEGAASIILRERPESRRVAMPTYVVAEQRATEQAIAPLLARPPSAPRPPAALASTVLGASAPTAPAVPFAAPDRQASEVFQRAVEHAARVQAPLEARPSTSGTVLASEDAAPPLPPAGLPDLTLDQYASLRAELEAGPERVAAILARYRVPTDGREALDAFWNVRLAADPTQHTMFAMRYATYLARLKDTVRARSNEASPATAPPAATFERAMVHGDPIQGPPAPSRPAGDSGMVGVGADGPPLGLAPEPSAAAAPPSLTLQQYASLCAEVAAFPDRTEAVFHRYGLGNRQERLTLDLSWQERLRRNPAEYQEWQALYQRWIKHFEQTKADDGPAFEPRVEPSHVLSMAAPPPPLELIGTAMAFELPAALRNQAAALPFQSGASSPLAAAPPEPKRPPAPSSAAGQTVGVGADLMAQVQAALPFGKRHAASAPIAYTRMTLEMYASFYAELAAFPDQTAAIFVRYNVSGEPARVALAQEWQTRFEAHPDIKVEWQKLVDAARASMPRR